MSISERIKALVEYEGSQVKLANKAGLQSAALSRIVNANTTTLRSDTLEAITKAYPKLNARWLLTGQGDMWLDQATAEKQQRTTARSEAEYQKELDTLRQLNQLQNYRLAELEREIREHAPNLAKRLGL